MLVAEFCQGRLSIHTFVTDVHRQSLEAFGRVIADGIWLNRRANVQGERFCAYGSYERDNIYL